MVDVLLCGAVASWVVGIVSYACGKDRLAVACGWIVWVLGCVSVVLCGVEWWSGVLGCVFGWQGSV